MSEEVKIPKRVFIVPYRNRVQQKFFFCKYMSFILENESDYEIYFSHQCDARTFNRGGTRNIGFLAVKNKYPEHYRDITFIFNDVDTIPFNKIFDYKTSEGVVKHYYGFKDSLGGIVVIKGADFERINGYPSFWGWGMEDNVLQKRCNAYGITIDRSVFYNIGSPEILQLFDGISRIISKKDPWRADKDDGIDGLKTIHKLQYTIDSKSENPHDNIFVVHNSRIFYINITTFLTNTRFEGDQYYKYDLREPKRKIIRPDKIKEIKANVMPTDNWTNIPYYPTTKERRINTFKHLMALGKPIPEGLLQQIQEDHIKEIQEDSYNNFNNNVSKNDDATQNVNVEEDYAQGYQQQQQHQQFYQSQHQQFYQSQHQQFYQSPQQQQQKQQQQQFQQPQSKFSPHYAQHIGQKPKAQASAKIRLGGVF